MKEKNELINTLKKAMLKLKKRKLSIEEKKKVVETVIEDDSVSNRAKEKSCKFVCLTNSKVPKKIFMKRGKDGKEKWKLVDEFSGYLLESQTTNEVGSVVTVEKFIESLPDPSKFVFRQFS